MSRTTDYIIGNDNLLEQLGQVFIFESTGMDIDFTTENINSSNDSLKAIDETIVRIATINEAQS